MIHRAYNYQTGQWINGEEALPLMRQEAKAYLRVLIEREVSPEFQTPVKVRELAVAIQQTRHYLDQIRAEELRLFQARDRVRAAERRKIWFSRPSMA